MNHSCQNCGCPVRAYKKPHRCYCHSCVVTDGGIATLHEVKITTNTENIPPKFAESNRHLNYIRTDEGDYWSKLPVAPWAEDHAYPAKGYKDKTTTFEEAVKYTKISEYEVHEYVGVPDNAYCGLGLFYHLHPESSDDGIVFIDLDDVRDPETGVLHKVAIGFLELANSYAQTSVSGTGIHIFLEGKLPDDVTAIQSELPEDDQFPDAEIEVYDHDRLIAMTGDQIEDTPDVVNRNDKLLGEVVEEFHTKKPQSVHDVQQPKEPAVSREEIRSVETTHYIKDVYDAIRHTKPGDIRIRSKVTRERPDGTKSLDPSWEKSSSGTRLAQLEDGWVYRAGMVGIDALKLVALEEGIITDVEDYPRGEAFPEAVEELRNRGAKIPKFDKTTLSLSNAVIMPELNHKNSGRKITTEQLRDKVCEEIRGAMERNENQCIDAVMSAGKTYGTFKTAHEIGQQVTYLAPRLDMYDQAVEYCEEIGFNREDIKILPSMKRQCPTWNGVHGKEWEKRVKRQYYAGARPKVIHEINNDIPCRHDHNEGGDLCPFEEMWDFDPDDYDVIIGHYKHAHVSHVTIGRACVFDEDPTNAFETTLAGEQLITAINTFLDMDYSPPVSDFDELLQIRNDRRRANKCNRWFNQMIQQDEFDFSEPDSTNVIARDGEDYHGYAPHAVWAILNTSPVADGSNFERGHLPDGAGGVLFFTTSDERGEYYVQFRESPDLEYASSVIALDGTPLVDESRHDGMKIREWSQSLGVNLKHNRILTDNERKQYIRNTLGHRYVQVTDSANPYSSGRYNNMTEDASLCAAVKELYGDGEAPVVFTPKKVADQYKDAGWTTKNLAKHIDYPGNLRGTDKYGSERLAVQLGSSHHGDHEIRRRAAWLNTDVEVDGKGMDRDYGSDLANAILRQMRENQTAQNVMRVGRDGGGAIVVLKTAAIPDYFPVVRSGAVTGWPGGMKEVLEARVDISPDGEKTVEVAEIAENDHVTVGERQVRNALDRFVELGYLKKMDHPQDGRKNVYVDDGLAAVDPDERAEVELPELDWPDAGTAEELGIEADTEIRVTNIYTSNFDKSLPTVSDAPETGVQIGVGDVTGDMDRGDPPTE